MNYIENEFFEEFKHLEKLCQEIYGRSGDNRLSVTLYLEDMKANEYQGSIRVAGWKEQYRQLKNCRNKRNNLVHPNDNQYSEPCSQDDIDFIISFRKAILNQTDPLALLGKHTKTVSRSAYENDDDLPYENRETSREKNYFLAAIIIFACIGVIMLLAFILFFSLIFQDYLPGIS